MIGWVLKLWPLLKGHWKKVVVVTLALMAVGYTLFLRREVLKGELEVSVRDAQIATLEASLSQQNSAIDALNSQLILQRERVLEASKKASESLTVASDKASRVIVRDNPHDSLKTALEGLFVDLEDMEWRKP